MLSYAEVDLAPICEQEMLQRSPKEQSTNAEGTQETGYAKDMEPINRMGKQQVLQIPSLQSFDPDVKMAETEKKESKYGCGEASCENQTCVKPHMKTCLPAAISSLV